MASFKERGFTNVIVVVLSILTAIMVVSSITLYQWISTPNFCNTCHIMSTRYVGWQRSTHKNVATCIQCHSGPGFVGEARAHIEASRYLWVILTGQRSREVLKSDVPDTSCLKCHDIDDIEVSFKAHDVDHKSHAEAGISCIGCHDNVSHGELLGGPQYPAMSSCADCHHEFDQAIAGCRTCHPMPGFTLNQQYAPAQNQDQRFLPEFSQGFYP